MLPATLPLTLRRYCLCITIALAAVACASAPAQTSVPSSATPPAQIQKQTLAGIDKLQTWYTQSTGLYQTTGWWNSANVLTMLADYSLVAHTASYNTVFSNSFQQAQKTNSGFLNNYYDDEGWWALAWIAAYDLTHTQQYLDMASSIFTDMSGGWDATCGGGIWWSKDKTYKNAIANELFLSVAAHLANRVAPTARSSYLDWANKEWAWFQQSGMINSQNLINDGLDLSTCKNNGQNTWTYNQGVILGGLVELNHAQRSPQLLSTAQTIANAAITNLSDVHGVLHDTCEANCGADGVQFKGIFLRNLMALHAAAPSPQYATFAVTNAESIWTHSRDAGNAFGQVWSGPFDAENAGSQSSALDAFVAAYASSLRH
jgi:predicted alpha-1,6-mannanase (GH76 family)